MTTAKHGEREVKPAKPAGKSDIRARLGESLERERARHREPRILDRAAYDEVVRGLIKIGGTDPDAKAPPRRRFD